MFDIDLRPIFIFVAVVGFVAGVVAATVTLWLYSHVSFSWS